MKTIRMPVAKRGKSSLAQIQRLMLDAVRRPLTGDELMQQKWSDGRDTGDVAKTFIKPNDRLTSFDRLEIYNQQYWWRLQENLLQDFRGLRAVIGDRQFEAVVFAYLTAHPSRSWTLRDLGAHMPAFITRHPELVAPKLELALEVARVELARVFAFDDPVHPAISVEEIASLDDRSRLRLQPYVQFLKLAYPVDRMLVNIKEHAEEAASNAASPNHSRTRRLTARRSLKPVHLIVHRYDFSVYYKRLEPEAFRLLLALRDGKTLAQARRMAFAGSTIPPASRKRKLHEWLWVAARLEWLCRPVDRK